MGFDLKSLKAYAKTTTNTGSVNNDSNNNYTSNSLKTNEKVSLWEKDGKEEEKKVSNTYEELLEEVMFGKEEETTEKTSSNKKINNTNGTVEDYEKNEINGGHISQTKDAINALLESELFQNQGIKDGASHIMNDVINNTQWKVDMDADGDGVIDQGVNLADAIAASFDSELDLYIESQLHAIMEKYQCYDIKALFGSENSQAVKDLAALGIRADAVGDDAEWQNRTYTFSLVEVPEGFEELSPEEQMEIVYSDDAKILTDSNGKKGSMIFADCLVPDGNAQGAELNLSSILDTMGYDCISKADFVGREEDYYELLDEVGADLVNGEYTSDGTTFADIYTEKTLKIWVATRARDTANGDAPGQWSQHLTFEQTMDRIERFGLGAEGGSLRQTGGLSKDNSLMSESDLIADAEKHAEAIEKGKELSRKQDILDKLVTKYENEHGEKPIGQALTKLEHQAEQQAKVQA